MADGGVEDLASLATLDEGCMLQELRARYRRDAIYTYIGDILVAVNPYKTLLIYGPEVGKKYTSILERQQLPPHLYAISDVAYQGMRRTGTSQCCVVSGESGAGKTESTKQMVQHVTQLCKHDTSDLHDRIVQVNPLLEAFGNAQTVINHNSSRFGKFIELKFDTSGNISGATIYEYLLEKSRVVNQALGERNFHIFYYLFAGLEEDVLVNNLRLDKPKNHRILKTQDGSPVFLNDTEQVYHQQMWLELTEIMRKVGFTEQHVGGILSVLGAVVHLSDVEFTFDADTDGVFIEDESTLEMAALLLSVTPKSLAEALISNVTHITGELQPLVTLKNLEQANEGRDALAKALYSRLFSWIVRQVNFMVYPDTRRHDVGPTIGILDIAGFENFKNNSYEQMCINTTNEQLQFYFNQHIFQWELNEYREEGIQATSIKFTDNQPLIDLFLKTPLGLFSLLDEESHFPRATDMTLIDKLTSTFGKKSHFQRPKGLQLVFIIQHYAGPVTYNAEGFLEKNRDTLSSNLMDCMKKSDDQVVTELFFSSLSNTGALQSNPNTPKRRNRKSIIEVKPPKQTLGRKPSMSKPMGRDIRKSFRKSPKTGNNATIGKTLGNQFKNSLVDLLERLSNAEPHFIRCVKPNDKKQAAHFDDNLVLQQLRYTGVLETVKIRRQGYATRLHYQVFMERYRFLAYSMTSRLEANAATCTAICERAGLEDCQYGKTKVFLKYWHLEQLNRAADQQLGLVVTCQAWVRMYLARRLLARLQQQRVQKQQKAVRDLCTQLKGNADLLLLKMMDHQAQDEKRYKEQEEAKRRKLDAEKHKKQDEDRRKKDQELRERKAREEAANLKKQKQEQLTPIPLVPAQPTPPPMRHVTLSQKYLQEMLEEALARYPVLSAQIWCKLLYQEKDQLVGKVYLREPVITISDSDQEYDGKHIGLLHANNFHNDSRDNRTWEVVKQVGQGVRIDTDREGNIYATQLGAANVIIKGYDSPERYCLSDEVIDSLGKLQKGVTTKIFDMSKFLQQIGIELRNPIVNQRRLEMLCLTNFAFVVNSLDDFKTPSWVTLINFRALDKLGDKEVLGDLLGVAHRGMHGCDHDQACALDEEVPLLTEEMTVVQDLLDLVETQTSKLSEPARFSCVSLDVPCPAGGECSCTCAPADGECSCTCAPTDGECSCTCAPTVLADAMSKLKVGDADASELRRTWKGMYRPREVHSGIYGTAPMPRDSHPQPNPKGPKGSHLAESKAPPESLTPPPLPAKSRTQASSQKKTLSVQTAAKYSHKH